MILREKLAQLMIRKVLGSLDSIKKILTTVWFGYDQPRSLGQKEYGSTTALPIWLDYMEDIISIQ